MTTDDSIKLGKDFKHLKSGDLIKYVDYTVAPEQAYYGNYVCRLKEATNIPIVQDHGNGWSDILVLSCGEMCAWVSWQCEVVK